MKDRSFEGHGTSFKPGMDLGPYDQKWLHGKEKNLDKLSEYDMKFIKQLLPDLEVMNLFAEPTTAKRKAREEGREKRKVKNDDGTVVEIDGE